MKMYLLFPIVLLLGVISTGCSSNESSTENQMKEGELVIKLCTRGCYQYLIKDGEDYYYPVNLDKDFQIREEFEIRFRGTILSTTKDILKPDPVDASVFDFSCPEIQLEAIERI